MTLGVSLKGGFAAKGSSPAKTGGGQILILRVHVRSITLGVVGVGVYKACNEGWERSSLLPFAWEAETAEAAESLWDSGKEVEKVCGIG